MARLPLSALLSQVLVAFTIEADNEFERVVPHRTTNHAPSAGARHGPWLVSTVMWWNCLRFVGGSGIRVGELERRARTPTNIAGMQRWGYVTVTPDPADSRPAPPPADQVIHVTRAGRRAQEVLRPLAAAIEQRWRTRFGADEIDRLRSALGAVDAHLGDDLPDCLPILGYGLVSRGRTTAGPRPAVDPPASEDDGAGQALPALLSRVLLSLALEFEADSAVSLAIAADVLRVLDTDGVRVRDLPRLSGVSKEAISSALGVLGEKRLALVEPDPGASRGKVVRLTPRGMTAADDCRTLLGAVEMGWEDRFGAAAVSDLRAALEILVDDPRSDRSPLFSGLEPPATGWRAAVRRPDTLPHFPMVLHRGGFPDGS